jgi:hypothetical protein
MPLFLIFIIFNNHSHSTIIHSFVLHHSPRPVFLYPHRFFAQQEKNLHEVPSREYIEYTIINFVDDAEEGEENRNAEIEYANIQVVCSRNVRYFLNFSIRIFASIVSRSFVPRY